MSAHQTIVFRATAAAPCPVCGTGSKGCSATADGLHLCRGEPTDPFTWRKVGEDEHGFRHYRRIGKSSPTTHPTSKVRTAVKNWQAEAERFVTSLTDELRQQLADTLGLPLEALAALPLLGWDGQAWTFPECDGTGQIIGISRRFLDGKKGFHKGGQRGLILPAGWNERLGPLFVVEGASDVLALCAAGLTAVGRPSNTGGAERLAVLLAGWSKERGIVVVGERDKKDDGSWPGRQGAMKVASVLEAKLGREVLISFPPDGSKDVRDWLTSPSRAVTPLPDRGVELGKHLEAHTEATTQRGSSSPPLPVLNTRRMDEIQAEQVNWLWHGRLPLAMLTMIEGDPELGKSTITIDLAARLSTGRPFPNSCEPVKPASVVFLCAEDVASVTVKPRLEAAGADLVRCHIIDSVNTGDVTRPVTLPHDAQFITQFIKRVEAKLLIVDPLMGFISGAVDTHKEQSIRDVLHGLKVLAEDTGAAVVALRHLNKNNGGPAIYRGGGSIAITAAARVVMTVGRNPSNIGEHILAVAKSNLARKPKALRYAIEPAQENPAVGRVVWGEESDLSADDIVTRPQADRRAESRDIAEEFLRRELASGAKPSEPLIEEAERVGISRATLFRARKELGVSSKKRAFSGGWVWSLPEGSNDENSTEDFRTRSPMESSAQPFETAKIPTPDPPKIPSPGSLEPSGQESDVSPPPDTSTDPESPAGMRVEITPAEVDVIDAKSMGTASNSNVPLGDPRPVWEDDEGFFALITRAGVKWSHVLTHLNERYSAKLPPGAGFFDVPPDLRLAAVQWLAQLAQRSGAVHDRLPG